MTAGARPRMLDLFCGAGGAARGYQRAGFYVVGVDIKPQPRYAGDEFIQADAMTFPIDGFDAIHASPPCQRFSKSVHRVNRGGHLDLIAATRARISLAPIWVIENVPSAPLIDPVRLCGSAFGHPVKRHRLFESNVPLMSNGCAHALYPRRYAPAWNRTTPLRFISISQGYTKPVDLVQAQIAMDIDWMTRSEMSLAIPPYYTEFIGRQLLASLGTLAESA